MDAILIGSIAFIIIFTARVVAMIKAYRSRHRCKVPAYRSDPDAQSYFSRRALSEQLERMHVRLFRGEVVTATEFDSSIRDIKSWIHRHSSDLDEQDIMLANQYVEVVIRAFSQAEQVFGFQQYYLAPGRTPDGLTLAEIRTRIHQRLCPANVQQEAREEKC